LPDFVRWFLTVLEVRWINVFERRLPDVTDESAVRAIRLAAILYRRKYSEVVIILADLLLGGSKKMVQRCFRDGMWLLTDPTDTDSLSWRDWSRGEMKMSINLFRWFQEAMRVSEDDSATDRSLLALARRLSSRRDLMCYELSFGPPVDPGNVGEAIFAARRPCRNVVGKTVYRQISQAQTYKSGTKMLVLTPMEMVRPYLGYTSPVGRRTSEDVVLGALAELQRSTESIIQYTKLLVDPPKRESYQDGYAGTRAFNDAKWKWTSNSLERETAQYQVEKIMAPKVTTSYATVLRNQYFNFPLYSPEL
jgi:hypothetical protein